MSISATRTIPQEIESLLIFRRRPRAKDYKSLTALADNEFVTSGPVKQNGAAIAALTDGLTAVALKIPDAPSVDGTYTLTCTVSGTTKTYEWVEQE